MWLALEIVTSVSSYLRSVSRIYLHSRVDLHSKNRTTPFHCVNIKSGAEIMVIRIFSQILKTVINQPFICICTFYSDSIDTVVNQKYFRSKIIIKMLRPKINVLTYYKRKINLLDARTWPVRVAFGIIIHNYK